MRWEDIPDDVKEMLGGEDGFLQGDDGRRKRTLPRLWETSDEDLAHRFGRPVQTVVPDVRYL